MGKKRSNSSAGDSSAAASSKNAPFNQAFRAVAQEMKARMKAEEEEKKKKEEAEKAKNLASSVHSRRTKGNSSRGSYDYHMSDDELFASAMLGVTPLDTDDRGHAPPPPPRKPTIVSADDEALARLCELVAGTGPFDISATDEFIQGRAEGVDERLVLSLKKGNFCIQGNLDLHGFTREEAKPKVAEFLRESRRLGRRCVLIIHGKGLNSKDHIPVLKESLSVWLCQGVIGQSVLAFCTALPCDGGTGAVYVLLKKR